MVGTVSDHEVTSWTAILYHIMYIIFLLKQCLYDPMFGVHKMDRVTSELYYKAYTLQRNMGK